MLRYARPVMVSMRILALTSIYQLGSVIALSVASLAVWPERGLAVLLGGLVMSANFWALRFLGARAMAGERPRVAVAIALSLKFVIVAGLLALLVLVFQIDVLGLALGMSSLFFGIGLATIHRAFTPRTELSSRAT